MKAPYTLRALSLASLLVLATTPLLAQNAYLANFSLPRFVKAGVNMPIVVRVRNLSSTPFFTFSVSWRVDGGATNTMPNFTVGGGGIVTNTFWEVNHPVQLNVPQGAHTLEIWVNTTVDTDMSNNMLTIDFTALSSWVDKVVLLEARTETWCPQCPPSNNVTNLLMANPDFAVAKFHLSDALDDCTECITYYNQHGINYTPAGIVEMGDYGTSAITSNYNLWDADMTARAQGVSPVGLTMTSSLNNTTRVLSVSVQATYTYALAGPHKLNVYVMEDNVEGPQQNAPANYIHHKVVRAMLGGVNGSTGVIPNTPVVGTPYTQTYTYTVPAGYDLGSLNLLAVVEHSPGGFNDRYALNSLTSGAAGVGIGELALGNSSLQAYPNPFVNDLYVDVEDIAGPARMELFSLDGRAVLQRNVVLNGTAATHLDLNGAGLLPGAYLLRITTAQGTAEQRVVKMD